MKIPLLLVCLITLAPLCAFAVTEENIHQTRAAHPGGTLVVDVDFGEIVVSPGDDNVVAIDARRKIEGWSKEKEQKYLAAAPITITTENDRVIVRATGHHESLGEQFWRLLDHCRREGRYTIRVPSAFNIDVHTAGGPISVTQTTGSVKADTDGGHLNFSQLHGKVVGETSGGNIAAKNCEGAINLDTSGGRIEVVGGSGTLKADTSGGGVTVANFSGDANLESSGGALRLDNISGNLKAETSGGSIADILPAHVTANVRLETSAGSITVVAPANATLNVDAETSAGSVRSELPIASTSSDREHIKGTINGGGKALVLHSGAGSIEIQAADKQAAR